MFSIESVKSPSIVFVCEIMQSQRTSASSIANSLESRHRSQRLISVTQEMIEVIFSIDSKKQKNLGIIAV